MENNETRLYVGIATLLIIIAACSIIAIVLTT
jgi:hypothetical protein